MIETSGDSANFSAKLHTNSTHRGKRKLRELEKKDRTVNTAPQSWLYKSDKEDRMPVNPNWTRDELILALDLYIRGGRIQLPAHHPEVIALSSLLNSLTIHEHSVRDASFRNTASVSMKLGNFLSIDPTHNGTGLLRGGKLDQEMWNEFMDKPYELAKIANVIRSTPSALRENSLRYNLTEEETFPEGTILTRLHIQKERNSKAVKQKKRLVLQKTGRLACEACGFDFAHTYGDLGKEFAECHHTVPISQIAPNHVTKLVDLAIVCANCHRMIHKSRPMLTVEQLQKHIRDNLP